MARNPSKTGSQNSFEELSNARTIAEEEHPHYMAGRVSDDEQVDEFTPNPLGPLPGPFPGPHPGPVPQPFPRPIPHPMPFPIPIPRPTPIPPLHPIPRFCSPVSGKYRYKTPVTTAPRIPVTPGPIPRPVVPRPAPGPIIPVNLQTVTVRVDVDRFTPTNRISIEVHRLFPRSSSHVIAEVRSDACTGLNQRTVVADITYRDGNAALIPGDTVTFRARRGAGIGYGSYELELSGQGTTPRTYNLVFVSDKFDPVEFEVDRVQNAGAIVTSIDTHDHPNRPGNLPDETITLATAFERAGFDVTMSPNTSVIPNADAGSNGTWSDTEMHNAMITYWSRFADRPSWAMWVLYAAQHDRGHSLGGIMFDDIGPNHRQGTAIFRDSFIQDVPAGDPNGAAWRRRMEFWTAVHEMGHAFNLAHSWQKALGAPQAPGDPWIPLANEPEARSFMNYPFNVSGGESAFFSDFEFRFSEDELIFMRHAPRRFVQMGNSDWFNNHAFEAPDDMMHTGDWALQIRPNRDANAYKFLEPVSMELKLTNVGRVSQVLDEDLLRDGGHISVFVQREGGNTHRWRPMVTRCHEDHDDDLAPGESIYGTHLISASTSGWIIDEPGFYKVQAAVDLGSEIVVSNVLRLYVSAPETTDEASVAPDYFTEDVGRAIAFGGAPALESATVALQTVAAKCPDNPATRHAAVALNSPGLRDFKVIDAENGREKMAVKSIRPKTATSAKAQVAALLSNGDAAADTMGHIPLFAQLRNVSEALEDAGDQKGANKVLQQSIDLMKKRKILPRIIDNAEARLKRRL